LGFVGVPSEAGGFSELLPERRNENVGAPTIGLNLLVNIVEENKRVMGERIAFEDPTPLFLRMCGNDWS
jgi:hypothetical protein